MNYYTSARNRTDINVTKVIDVAHYEAEMVTQAADVETCCEEVISSGCDVRVSIATGCADVVHTVYGFYKQWLGNGRVSTLLIYQYMSMHIDHV